MPHYDAIVTGAGLTGLAAALSLAQEQRRVLLVDEQAAPLGGCLPRGRFEFDAGPWRWCAPALTASEGGFLWQKLNLREGLGLEVLTATEGGSLSLPAELLHLPAGPAELEQALAAASPDKGWPQLWALCEECGKGMQALANGGDKALLSRSYPGFQRYGGVSVERALSLLRLSDKSKSLLTALSPLIFGGGGDPLFGPFAAQLYQYAASGLSRPKQGWYALGLGLLERCRELGVDIRLGCRLRCLRLEQGRVQLQSAAGADEAPQLLWAAEDGPLWDGSLDPGLRLRFPAPAALRACRGADQVFLCRLGLACSGEELGFSSVLALSGGPEAGSQLLAQLAPGEDETCCSLLLTLCVSREWFSRVSAEDEAARVDRLARSALTRLGAALERDIFPYIEEMELSSGAQPWLEAGPEEDSALARLLDKEAEWEREGLFLAGPGQRVGCGPEAELALGSRVASRMLEKEAAYGLCIEK